MRRPPKPPVQCVAELDGDGFVLAGTMRSIGLVLEDALRCGAEDVFVLTASGELAWLRVRDGEGRPLRWMLRDVVW